ncbi:chromate transporter [Massilia horti]|uniref:Chromate transporter n=1 Tax=Massilia horti TaxID=2562153 RepID=A0A4Y9T4A4_9BURK|nr:chromate transporter [Massilia horti]TFW34834.1 chromate transporter [Massilia horti]
MNAPLHLSLGLSDWLSLFAHFLLMSLMSLGGAISTTSEMHRFLVENHHWLTQEQFNDSIALAQAAPGPNVLFVALMGWHVGLNAGGTPLALLGAATTMVGIMIPSTVVTYFAAQWGHRNRDLRPVRAFKQGMAPIVVALVMATAWILGSSAAGSQAWRLWLLSLVAGLLIWRTKLHILWLLGAGALLGALQLV